MTDAEGRYRIPDLRPGFHIVTFKLSGFGTVIRGIALSAGRPVVVDAELLVGPIDDLIPLTPPAALGDGGAGSGLTRPRVKIPWALRSGSWGNSSA